MDKWSNRDWSTYNSPFPHASNKNERLGKMVKSRLVDLQIIISPIEAVNTTLGKGDEKGLVDFQLTIPPIQASKTSKAIE